MRLKDCWCILCYKLKVLLKHSVATMCVRCQVILLPIYYPIILYLILTIYLFSLIF